MSTVKGFILGINRVFAANGGVMWEKLNDSQLRQFLMAELEKFHSEGMRKKKAALNNGKQPDSNVYVFNSSVQVYNVTMT